MPDKTRFGEVVDYLVSGAFDGKKYSLSRIEKDTLLPFRYLSTAAKVESPGIDKVNTLAVYFNIPLEDLAHAILDSAVPLNSLKRRDSWPEERPSPLWIIALKDSLIKSFIDEYRQLTKTVFHIPPGTYSMYKVAKVIEPLMIEMGLTDIKIISVDPSIFSEVKTDIDDAGTDLVPCIVEYERRVPDEYVTTVKEAVNWVVEGVKPHVLPVLSDSMLKEAVRRCLSFNEQQREQEREQATARLDDEAW